ncbi:MAG: His/Gly/Thr/Pro-type tRNA ligase C-terminal domain-containing protein [Saprospiraceae bacterium]
MVIVPIPKPSDELNEVSQKLQADLKAKGISVKIDDDDKKRPGFKFAEYEMIGIPVRVGIGLRDLEKGVYEIARRDTKEKYSVKIEEAVDFIENLLVEIQDNLYQNALNFRKDHSFSVDNFEDFKKIIEADGGFVYAHWDGTADTEEKIKELTKATIRCIPLDAVEEDGIDMISGKPSKRRVLFAKAY